MHEQDKNWAHVFFWVLLFITGYFLVKTLQTGALGFLWFAAFFGVLMSFLYRKL